MTTPNAEEFVQELLGSGISLSHAYDAAKAREYYLRNRELKGRKKGVAQTPAQRAAAAAAAQKAKRAKALAEHKAAEARVAELKARLAKLDKLLKELVKQAKARSGIDSKAKPTSKTPDKKAKPLTAAQKRDAAKRAKANREKDGDQSLSAEAKELEAKIKKVRERIAKMRAQIAAAKKKSKSKTARNGR